MAVSHRTYVRSCQSRMVLVINERNSLTMQACWCIDHEHRFEQQGHHPTYDTWKIACRLGLLMGQSRLAGGRLPWVRLPHVVPPHHVFDEND